MGRFPRSLRVAARALALPLAALALASCGGAPPPQSAQARVAPGTPYPIRGIYDRDQSATGFDHEVALGFNLIDTGPDPAALKTLAAHHLKGFIWLGGYSNTTCSFHESDAWVRTKVRAIAGDPAIGGYFIDDEPDAALCPTAPAQIKARAQLVKSIDPGPPTFIAAYAVDQFARFAHTVDVIALDHYPCSRLNGCDFSFIDQEAAEADRLGIRYWGVIQAHGDDWYKVPTPAELHQEFLHWRATRMEGYLVFAWHWPAGSPSLWLRNHPELQSQLKAENGA